MHDKLLEFLKHMKSLLRALRLLILQKPFKQFSENFLNLNLIGSEYYHSSSDIPQSHCSDGVGGSRYYFCFGYLSSHVSANSQKQPRATTSKY